MLCIPRRDIYPFTLLGYPEDKNMPRPERIPQAVKYMFLLGIISERKLRRLLEKHNYHKGQVDLAIEMLKIKKHDMDKEDKW